jgi:hypothetical protein
MRKFACLFLGFFFLLSTAWAQQEDGHDAMLNKIILKLSAEQWVTTKSALVNISVNATVNGAALDKVQAEVLAKLASISSAGVWHILSFDRSQDQSGLEKVTIVAQARLPSGGLSNLRDQAKAITKPGETFNVDSITFTPSEDEIRDANTAVRSLIYGQTKDEIDRLDKLYPDQRYYVHTVDFVNDFVRMPTPMMPMNGFAMRAMAAQAPAPAMNSGLEVGDKLVVTATVVLASLPADRTLLKTIT